MLEAIEKLLSQILNIINSFGFLGVAGGMLIESACIPLPSELVLPLAGFMVLKGRLTFVEANIAALAGSMIGSYAAYFLGFFGGRPIVLKYGKYFLLSDKKFFKAENMFNKFGSAAVFFGRLLPVIRTFISLPAGITRMNPIKFGIYSLLGAAPWNLALIYLGYRFGAEYETIVRPIFKKFEYVVIALIVLVILLLIARALFKRKVKES